MTGRAFRDHCQVGEGIGQRRLTQLHPDRVAPMPVRLFELNDSLPCNRRRLAFQRQEDTPQVRFFSLVGLRPRRQRPGDQVGRRRHAQEVRNPRIQGRGLGKAPPDRFPRPFPTAEPLRRHQLTVLFGIEPVVRLAARHERAPTRGIPARRPDPAISEPDQQISHRVIREEPVEVLRFETPAFQPL